MRAEVKHEDLPKLGQKSLLELLLAQQLRSSDCPTPETHFRFCAGRKWEFDLAWPEFMVAVEIEGGIWTGGRHVRAKGFAADVAKYNRATMDGWRLYRFTGDMVNDGSARDLILRVLGVGLGRE